MLRREQERIGAELRATESRQGVLDASLDDWQDVMELALRFSTRCATGYRRGSDRTRKLFNAAVFERLDVKGGRLCHEQYRPPFDGVFTVSEFEYGTRVGREGFEPP